MKKNLFWSFGLMFGLASAQVGINTSNPTGVDLAINDDDTGLKVDLDGTFKVKNNGTETLIIDPNGNVGIGVNPGAPLHVNADNKLLKIDNLNLNTAANAEFIVIDPSTGEVGRRVIANTSGQILRVGLNTGFDRKGNPGEASPQTTFNGHTSTVVDGEFAVGFSNYNSTAEMLDSPAGAGFPNFVNTITGANMTENAGCTSGTTAGNAGNGAPDRCTDQIQLPAGIYRITLRIVGRFQQNRDDNSLDVKVIVNNNEYSYANGIVSGGGSTVKTGYLVETLNLTDSSNTLDFTFVRNTGGVSTGNYFELQAPEAHNGGLSFRNILTIEKLQ